MLAAVTRILRERNLLKTGEEPAFNVSLTSQEQVTLQAFAPNGAHFHARVKRRGVVPDEYESCCAAWRSFPQYAPEPLGRHFINGWEIILLAGIGHDAVAVGDIGRNRHGLVEKLAGYFSASKHVPRTGEAHREFLRCVRERATGADSAAILDEWMSADRLDGLACIPQHGDFTVNNLGLSKGRLVVFDWEDFGRVSLPGLDLCTAIASDAGLDSERFGAVMQGAYARLVDRSCPLIGLTPELFLRLIPLYLAIFLDLKRGYGEPVRLALRGLIRGLGRGRR